MSLIDVKAKYRAHSFLLCKQGSSQVFVYIFNVKKKIPDLDLKGYDKR